MTSCNTGSLVFLLCDGLTGIFLDSCALGILSSVRCSAEAEREVTLDTTNSSP